MKKLLTFAALLLAAVVLVPSAARADGHIGFWRFMGLGWGPGYHAGNGGAQFGPPAHQQFWGAPGVPAFEGRPVPAPPAIEEVVPAAQGRRAPSGWHIGGYASQGAAISPERSYSSSRNR